MDTTASCENVTGPPSTKSTEAIDTPARLPWATKDNFTGKKAPASSPPTENSKEPDRSSALTKAIDQSNECEDGLSDHSPV